MADTQGPAVRLTRVSKRFGQAHVLREISWDVPPGHVVGLLGLNGAGKTTLLRLLIGLLRASDGIVEIGGTVLTPGNAALRDQVGYVPERTVIPGGFTADRLESLGCRVFPRWDRHVYATTLDRFQIGRRTPVYLMSQGQRTLTAVAFAFAHGADLLILDEPTNGLDPLVRREFLSNLIEEAYDHQRTVIVSSHRLDEVEHLAQDIAILHHGTLVTAGALDALLQQDRMLLLRDPNGQLKTWGDVPGASFGTRDGPQMSVYVRDFVEGAVREFLAQRGIAEWTLRDVSLDEFFEERVRSDVG